MARNPEEQQREHEYGTEGKLGVRQTGKGRVLQTEARVRPNAGVRAGLSEPKCPALGEQRICVEK